MHEDFKILVTMMLATGWIFGNIVIPLNRLSNLKYDTKIDFWMDMLIPYCLTFRVLYWAGKALKKEAKEEIKNLSQGYKFLE